MVIGWDWRLLERSTVQAKINKFIELTKMFIKLEFENENKLKQNFSLPNIPMLL